jgi:hypothetical protein
VELSIAAEYPADSVNRCCFLTGMSRGTIWELHPDGPVERPEVVVITDREVLYEGRVVVGERAIRHLAHGFGLVDGWRFERIAEDNQSLRAELIELSKQLGQARAEIDRLEEMERPDKVRVFCAVDGTEHASGRGAREHSAALLDATPALLEKVTTADPLAVDDELEPEEGVDVEPAAAVDFTRGPGLLDRLRSRAAGVGPQEPQPR